MYCYLDLFSCIKYQQTLQYAVRLPIINDESLDIIQRADSKGVDILAERMKNPRVPSGPDGILVTFSGTCVIAMLLLLLDLQNTFCSEFEEHKDDLLMFISKSRLYVESLLDNGPQSADPRRFAIQQVPRHSIGGPVINDKFMS